MNNEERILIRHICDGDMKRAKIQVRAILASVVAPKDVEFRDDMLRRLDAKKDFANMPDSVKGLLGVEDASSFRKGKFLIRKNESEVVEKTISIYRAAERLANMGIPYLPALILYGESGCGKTELARYIANRAELPFAYVRFSSLVDAHLGATQSNIARIFEWASSNPCVLCFDEIDAIGTARGNAQELGEMNRVVIAVMQELDRVPNNVIIVGTTNRFDQLDPALVRRFPLRHELLPLSRGEARELAHKFFQYTGIPDDGWVDKWFDQAFGFSVPASSVVRECTNIVVEHILREEQ